MIGWFHDALVVDHSKTAVENGISGTTFFKYIGKCPVRKRISEANAIGIYFNHKSCGRKKIMSIVARRWTCLLYTSDAADEEDSVDLGGRRIIKKKKKK